MTGKRHEGKELNVAKVQFLAGVVVTQLCSCDDNFLNFVLRLLKIHYITV